MIKSTVLATLLILLSAACDEKESSKKREPLNEKAVHSFVTQVWNNKDLSDLEDFFSDQIVRRVNNVDVATDKNELAAHIEVYLIGFLDLKLVINELITFQNKVFMTWTMTGTNTGIFGELPPTGKKVTVSGISRIDFNTEGLIIYENVFYNELSFLQQLGYSLLPPVVQ